jgi:hypothetical protein
MPPFSPALITIMRSVLEDAMTKVPAEQATTVTKALFSRVYFESGCRRPDQLRRLDNRGTRPATDHRFHVHVMVVKAGHTFAGESPALTGS